MLYNHLAYLKGLQTLALEHDIHQFYLWPRTPIKSDLQEEIIQRVGVSDFDVSNRVFKIISDHPANQGSLE